MTEKTTSQVLQEARALVAAGWCQGPYHMIREGQPCYCAAGAVLTALGTPPHRDARYAAPFVPLSKTTPMQVLQRAASRLDPTVDGVIQYNEHPARTQEEVLALFDEALAEVTK